MKAFLLILFLCLSTVVQADYVSKHLCCWAIATPLSTASSEPAKKSLRTRLLISSLALGVVLYGATNWWEDSSGEFRVRNEGWFEADSPNGGADKLGHGYSAYVSTRLLTKGFQWSPEGDKIAFMRFDESDVKEWTLTYYGELYPEKHSYKYPKAGEDNSVVTVHIYDLNSGKTTMMDVGEETDQYIPRIKWTPVENQSLPARYQEG